MASLPKGRFLTATAPWQEDACQEKDLDWVVFDDWKLQEDEVSHHPYAPCMEY